MLTSARPFRVVDYQFVNRTGWVFDGRLAASGEFVPDGYFVGNWFAIADVTAEKRADRELRQAQRMEAVGQLTAGVAYDFNNTLISVLGNFELLSKRPAATAEGEDDVRTQRLIEGVKSAALRGAKLIGQLLGFSR